MAALSNGPLCPFKHKPTPIIGNKRSSRMLKAISGQIRDPNNRFNAKTNRKIKEEKRLIMQKLLGGMDEIGKGIKDNLSPKGKGDWKDITLMSLSFAVYVYMSQKIVCAYCALMSMLGQP
ncbi:sulfotransferase family cytosolic 1B member 1 [Striga asiatica]|uniref:Sulfotransferase family cytosolic 1B member 1 n=1 Tax=Striga asiatica TaxID=4170 RepID=A0A5A7QK79_STRAF|nr:sulfotransferase family cytosolic 1B member 1 [Striga asiatica]